MKGLATNEEAWFLWCPFMNCWYRSSWIVVVCEVRVQIGGDNLASETDDPVSYYRNHPFGLLFERGSSVSPGRLHLFG